MSRRSSWKIWFRPSVSAWGRRTFPRSILSASAGRAQEMRGSRQCAPALCRPRRFPQLSSGLERAIRRQYRPVPGAGGHHRRIFPARPGLPPEAISYEGLGESQPVASNATEAGRALNRRVEVEVWYDEISEKMVEKEVIVPRQVNRVKVCRTETVCKLRYKEGHCPSRPHQEPDRAHALRRGHGDRAGRIPAADQAGADQSAAASRMSSSSSSPIATIPRWKGATSASTAISSGCRKRWPGGCPSPSRTRLKSVQRRGRKRRQGSGAAGGLQRHAAGAGP